MARLPPTLGVWPPLACRTCAIGASRQVLARAGWPRAVAVAASWPFRPIPPPQLSWSFGRAGLRPAPVVRPGCSGCSGSAGARLSLWFARFARPGSILVPGRLTLLGVGVAWVRRMPSPGQFCAVVASAGFSWKTGVCSQSHGLPRFTRNAGLGPVPVLDLPWASGVSTPPSPAAAVGQLARLPRLPFPEACAGSGVLPPRVFAGGRAGTPIGR